MTPSPLNWKPLAGRTLEAALNRALALDPDTRDQLRALDGQRIALRLDAPPLAVEVRVDGERLVVGPVDAQREPDLGVRSTLGALVAQLPMFRRDDAPPVGRLHVSGDAELARRLQRLAERFDQIANAVAGALKQARATARNLAQSAAEFVTEESRDVVGRDELNAFHDDVDALRDDVERLAARISRLPPGLRA